MVLTLEETLKAVKKFQNLVEHVHRPGNNGSFFPAFPWCFFCQSNMANECQVMNESEKIHRLPMATHHFFEEMK